ncbi:uncharacterized protein LOC119464461 isoform X1 [Dermacentor silvarum]|uniref:uncharacterized protein LOC119464461 isoform X1 n=1 Tax=Dermacentor silvarum TaxID=543639 RepID=UPI001898DDB5|nr:uncharacterized protein LOC119464461 isoform X1 [Dermacentor silvarum]
MMFIILLSFLAIGAADFDYHARPKFLDVIKFYKPGTVTYLVKRTYKARFTGEEPWCLYNKVLKVSGNTLEIDQGYSNRTQNVRYQVRVVVSVDPPTDQAPSMSATKGNDPKQTREYYFHFYDPVAQCAVITFKDYSGTWRCELHTWKDKAYYKYFKNCEDEYEYQCPGRESHSVYLYYCPA